VGFKELVVMSTVGDGMEVKEGVCFEKHNISHVPSRKTPGTLPQVLVALRESAHMDYVV